MSNVKVSELLITSLETITAYGINGGALRFVMDELQNATISNSQTNDAMTGKGGRTIGQLKRNKSVTISGTNGMVTTGMIEAQVGSEGEHKLDQTVRYMDYIEIASDTATTTYKAVGTAGAEIVDLIVKNADGTIKERLTQDATATATTFTYDPTTKKLGFATHTYDDGTSIVVCYNRAIEADVVSNISDNYSEKLELYVDAFAEDKCHNEYHIQFYVPYADFTGTFDFAMGDSQTTQAFEATSLPSTCGNGSTKFWDYIIFGADAEDYGG